VRVALSIASYHRQLSLAKAVFYNKVEETRARGEHSSIAWRNTGKEKAKGGEKGRRRRKEAGRVNVGVVSYNNAVCHSLIVPVSDMQLRKNSNSCNIRSTGTSHAANNISSLKGVKALAQCLSNSDMARLCRLPWERRKQGSTRKAGVKNGAWLSRVVDILNNLEIGVRLDNTAGRIICGFSVNSANKTAPLLCSALCSNCVQTPMPLIWGRRAGVRGARRCVKGRAWENCAGRRRGAGVKQDRGAAPHPSRAARACWRWWATCAQTITPRAEPLETMYTYRQH